MTNIAWFNCFSGIAGDMALGSLIDAGADLEKILFLLKKLPIDNFNLQTHKVSRGSISATKLEITALDNNKHRNLSQINNMLEKAQLPSRLKNRAQSTFNKLAIAEGKIHNKNPQEVEFHEVGSLDAIIDIVGTCAALEVLDISEVFSSPIAIGTGFIDSNHGILPNPAPAVAQLLKTMPVFGIDIELETTTPTGAALLASTVSSFGPMPSMEISSVGYGAGTANPPQRPNCTQVIIGNTNTISEKDFEPLIQLDTNLDDTTGEVIAYTAEQLFKTGALDVWVTPIMMKKGRPGHLLSCLCNIDNYQQLIKIIKLETGSLGVRVNPINRSISNRQFQSINIDNNPLMLKITSYNAKAEYEQAAQIARAQAIPIREVLTKAHHYWLKKIKGL